MIDGRTHFRTKFVDIEFNGTERICDCLRKRIVVWVVCGDVLLHGTIQIPYRRVNNPFMLRPSRVTVTVLVTVTITARIAIRIVIVIRRVRILGQQV